MQLLGDASTAIYCRISRFLWKYLFVAEIISLNRKIAALIGKVKLKDRGPRCKGNVP